MRRKAKTTPKEQPPQQDSDGPAISRWPWLIHGLAPCVLILLAATICYWNADHEEFLFDSIHIVQASPEAEIRTALHRMVTRPLRPSQEVSRLSFALNAWINTQIGRPPYEVTSFLVVNVLIHAFNGMLVYFLVRRLLAAVEPERPPAVGIPLVLGLLFTVHPLMTSSVAYIIQRRGALSATFFLMAVLCYLKARLRTGAAEDATDESRPAARAWPPSRILAAVGVVVGFWLSAKTKQVGLTLPFALLMIEFCLRAAQKGKLKRFMTRALVPGLAVSVVAMFAYAWMMDLFSLTSMQVEGWGSKVHWGPWAHFLTEARVFLWYGMMVWLPAPALMCIDHQVEVSYGLLDHGAGLAVLIHAALLTLAVWAARRGYTLAALGVFWFYIPLIPYVLLPQTALLVEYKTYLPAVGMVLILAEPARRWRARVPWPMAAGVAGMILILLVAGTIARNRVYQSPLKLWADAVEKYPNKARVQNNYGFELMRAGKPEAQKHLLKAAELRKDDPEILNNLGLLSQAMNARKEALIFFHRAVELDPDFERAQYNLGLEYLKAGRPQDAEKALRKALELHTREVDEYLSLGSALEALGRHEEAVAMYDEAIKRDPRRKQLHYNRANALAALGRADDAIDAYRRALERDDQFVEAHANLAVLLARQLELEQALPHFQRVVDLRPEDLTAERNLIRAYLDLGYGEEAKTLCEEALDDRPKDPLIWVQLGDAERLLGNLDTARQAYLKALDHQPGFEPALDRLGIFDTATP